MNCARCGGPTKGQTILLDSHLYLPDCIAYLKLENFQLRKSLKMIQAVLKARGEHAPDPPNVQTPNESDPR